MFLAGANFVTEGFFNSGGIYLAVADKIPALYE